MTESERIEQCKNFKQITQCNVTVRKKLSGGPRKYVSLLNQELALTKWRDNKWHSVWKCDPQLHWFSVFYATSKDWRSQKKINKLCKIE